MKLKINIELNPQETSLDFLAELLKQAQPKTEEAQPEPATARPDSEHAQSKPKRAVIYARNEFNCDTLLDEIEACHKYAILNNYTICERYCDVDASDAGKRTEFKRMIEDSKQKLFDVALVYSFSHLGRNLLKKLEAENELKQSGVSVISVSEPTQNGAGGAFMRTVLVNMNEYYSKEMSQKIKRGLALKKQKEA